MSEPDTPSRARAAACGLPPDGTAAEVTPIRSIDDHEIGVGPITLELQKTYLGAVRGADARWEGWLEFPSAARAEA